MENYQKLKEVIQAANPDFNKRLMQVNQGAGVEITVRDDNIRLADVLLAIEKNLRGDSYFVDAIGGLHEWFAPMGRLDLRTVSHWNLKDDNLDYQSDETKQFLIDLLVTGSQ